MASLVAAQQPPQFEGAVDVVAVDANVVDEKGRPVPDLALEEFVVKVDGKSRRVISAEFFASRVSSPKAAPALASDPAAATPRDHAGGRAAPASRAAHRARHRPR